MRLMFPIDVVIEVDPDYAYDPNDDNEGKRDEVVQLIADSLNNADPGFGWAARADITVFALDESDVLVDKRTVYLETEVGCVKCGATNLPTVGHEPCPNKAEDARQEAILKDRFPNHKGVRNE